MTEEAAITTLIRQIDSMPFDREQLALIRDGLRRSEDAGLEKLEYALRMRLTTTAALTSDTDAQLSSFAWCLSRHDSSPLEFPREVDGHDLLWQFKWMPSTMASSPVFSLDEIAAVLDDMESRYLRAGVGPSGVLQARFQVACLTGREDEAEELLARLRATDRDYYSHCDACARSEDAAWLAASGREAEALAKFEEIFDGYFTCNDEPELALARAMVPYLRAGQFDKAKAAHLKSYRMCRDDTDDLHIVAKHLEFCAITGNEARGLELVERHIGWLIHDKLDSDHQFRALCAIGLVLDAVARSGHPAVLIRGAHTPELSGLLGTHDGAWTAAELAGACWAAAAVIAAAFDARNGNDYWNRQRSTTAALADEHFEIPVGSPRFQVEATPRNGGPLPDDAVGWLTRAREAVGVGDRDGAQRAARAGLAALRPAGRDTPADLRTRASLLSILIQSVKTADSTSVGMAADERDSLLKQRIGLLRAMGRGDQAELEDRSGYLLFGDAESEDDRRKLDEALEASERSSAAPETIANLASILADLHIRHGEPQRATELYKRVLTLLEGADWTEGAGELAGAYYHVASIEAQAGGLVEAVEHLDRMLALEIDRALRAEALQLRSQLKFEEGDLDQALDDANHALDLYLLLDARARAADASVQSAALYHHLALSDESVSRWRLALDQTQLGDLENSASVRFGLGRELVYANRCDEAIEVLSQVLELEVASAEESASIGETRIWLARAYREVGDHMDASSQYVLAAQDFHTEGDADSEASARMEVGRLLLGFDEAEAVNQFDLAVAVLRNQPESTELLTVALHTLGQAKLRIGDHEGLHDLDAALELAAAGGESWQVADITDTKARALVQLERTDEAMPLILQAAEGYSTAGDTIASGLAEYLAAQLLVGAGRGRDAVALFDAAVEKLAEHHDALIAARLDYGKLLRALGRLQEAERVLDGVPGLEAT